MAEREKLYATPAITTASLVRPVFVLVAIAGALLGVAAEWRAGAVLMIVGAVGSLGAQLVIGIAAYRRAMRAEWPKVAPIRDDDWD